MKRIQELLLLTIMIFSFPMASMERLSAHGGWAKHPVLTLLDNGQLMCLWGEGVEESSSDIVFRKMIIETGQWSPKFIAVKNVYAANYPQIVQDWHGVVHMAYQDGQSSWTRDAWYTRYDYLQPEGHRWVMPQLVYRTPRENSAWPRISIDPLRGDLYVSWQHKYADNPASPPEWHSNIVVVQCLKDQESGLYGSWSEPVKISRTIERKHIHQATVYADGQLHSVWEEGEAEKPGQQPKSDWQMTYNFVPGGGNFKEGEENTVTLIPGAAIPSYWCEMEADSRGNLYLVYSRRLKETRAAFKPVGGEWRDLGTIIKGGIITMIGLEVTRNDVAYVIHNQGSAYNIRPVFARFTDQIKTSPVVITDYQKMKHLRVLEIAVDDRGTAHCAWAAQWGEDKNLLDVYFEKVDQPAGGPVVELRADPEVALTDEDITFSGTVISSENEIVNHRFVIKSQKFWGGDSPSYTTRFSSPGIYTVHYYVADSNLLMGHDSIEFEVLDAPYQPTGTELRVLEIRGFLFRAYMNRLGWRNDSRNDERFSDISHFNIYRRSSGDPGWGDVLDTVSFSGSDVSHEYLDRTAFLRIEDAESYEYAVSVVAVVDGIEKESKKSQF